MPETKAAPTRTLIAGGMSPVAVAHRLGRKDATETLKTYAHLWSDDDTRAAVLRPFTPPEIHAAAIVSAAACRQPAALQVNPDA